MSKALPLAFYTAVLWAGFAHSATEANSIRPSLPFQPWVGVRAVEGIVPSVLRLGVIKPKQGIEPKCIRIVVVMDPEVACKLNRCDHKVFFNPVKPVALYQRAFHVYSCNADPDSTPGLLLTDRNDENSSTIWGLLPYTTGKNMWSQKKAAGRYSVGIRTVASEGDLVLPDELPVWTEGLE